MKARIIFLICVQMAYINQLMAQQEPDNFLQSPEVAAFNKYFDYPVSYYTGTTNISIPIYSISFEGTSIPISISYHPSGIRVNEEATWVGLGWSLSAGGQISKIVRGKDDFDPQGYINAHYYIPDYQQYEEIVNGESHFDFKTLEARKMWDIYDFKNLEYYDSILLNGVMTDYYNYFTEYGYDYESDLYNLSIPGYSVQFFFDRNLKVQFVEKQDLKIKRINGNFEVTTPDGLIYIFDEIISYQDNYISKTSSWLLTSIRNPQNSKSVIFKYSKQKAISQYSYFDSERHNKSIGICSENEKQPFARSYTCYERYIDSIIFENGAIIFYPDTLSENPREDLDGSLRLERIKVVNNKNDVIKDFTFYHSYFTKNSSGMGFEGELPYENISHLRLKLDLLKEEGKPPFKFSYVTNTVPAKTTFDQDLWGYYNGESNSTLIPEYIYDDIKYEGANRDPNGDFAKSGLLKEITYPTGGKTEFQYEANRVKRNTFKRDEIVGEYKEDKDIIEGELIVDNSNRILNIDADLNIYNYNSTNYFREFNEVTIALIKKQENPGDPKEVHYLKLYMIANSPYFNTDLKLGYWALDGKVINRDEISIPKGEYLLTRNKDLIKEYDPHLTKGLDPIPNDSKSYVSVTIKYYKEADPDAMIDGPGLRIKSIKSFDIVSGDSITKNYEYNNGVLLTKPQFHDLQRVTYNLEYGCYPLYIFSYLTNHLSTSSGSYVGYGDVTEYYEDSIEKAKLKNVYTFHNKESIICDLSNGRKVPSYDDPLNGRLKNIKNYTRLDNEWKLVKEKKSFFSYSNTDIFPMLSYRVLSLSGNTIPSTIIVTYGMNSNFIKLDSVVEEIYGSNDQEKYVVKTENKYTSDKGYYNLRESIISKSDGGKLRNVTLYPFDYNNVGFTDEMMDAYMVGMPVEQYTVSEKGKVLAGSLIKYKTEGRAGLVDEVHKLKQKGLTIAEFLPSNVSGFKTGYYELQAVYDKYDNGKLVQMHKANDINITYLWGYNQSLPVAKIENASYMEVKTALGAIGSSISDIETKSLLSNDESLLITLFNTLRQYRGMSKAVITSYTYDLLIGMTSQTDPNGITMYYEYDDFNRLKLMRDDEGSILNHYKYNYRGQK